MSPSGEETTLPVQWWDVRDPPEVPNKVPTCGTPENGSPSRGSETLIESADVVASAAGSCGAMLRAGAALLVAVGDDCALLVDLEVDLEVDMDLDADVDDTWSFPPASAFAKPVTPAPTVTSTAAQLMKARFRRICGKYGSNDKGTLPQNEG